MLLNKTLCRCCKTIAMAAAAMSLTACSWMNEGEDLAGCPTGDFVVQFVYDYNMQRADMFRDHVGEVNLYVYDEAGRLVTQRTANDRQAISDRNNRFGITLHAANQPGEADLVAGHKYRFVAVAGQKAGAIVRTSAPLPAFDTGSARFRQTAETEGSYASAFAVALDRASTPDAYGCYPVSNTAPLDTLWHSLGALPTGCHDTNKTNGQALDNLVTVRHNIVDSVNVVAHQPADTLTLSLMRDTKLFAIALRNLDEDKKATLSADDYRVEITAANGLLLYSSDHRFVTPAAPESDVLLYTPYAAQTTSTVGRENPDDPASPEVVTERAAHYYLATSRLMYDKETEKAARLRITRKSDNKCIADINLPATLADDRIMQAYRYGEQEYLDRQHEYHLDFFLRGDSWEFMNMKINVNITPWVVRIQNEAL